MVSHWDGAVGSAVSDGHSKKRIVGKTYSGEAWRECEGVLLGPFSGEMFCCKCDRNVRFLNS